MKNNPFFKEYNQPFNTIPFDEFETEHFLPAIHEAIKISNSKIDNICNLNEDASFENTVLELETSHEDLQRIVGIYWHLFGAHSQGEFKKLAQEISPIISSHTNDYMLNEKLFRRIKDVYDNRLSMNYDEHDLKLIDDTYQSFIRNGASLSDQDKEKLRNLDKELSVLSPKFSNNVLDAQNSFEMWLTDENDLEGLPEDAINAAKESAKEKNKEDQWLFTLQMASYLPFMTYSKKRHLREELSKAYGSLCNGGKYNNNDIVRNIVKLKHKRAQLLGYKSHADFVLERRMAENVENVYGLLDNLYDYSYSAAKSELDEIREYAMSQDGIDSLCQWDLMYYKEALKKEKYAFDSEELRPYFKAENVINGVFQIASKLYGLIFKKLDNVQTWHEEVDCFEVNDADGSHIGILYIDLFPRSTKRSGAWMNALLENGFYKGKIRRPHVLFCASLTPSTKDKPSLLNYREVETVFHEFGHCLHGLLSDGKYQSTSGTNVFWDFVELPSQIMENWVGEPEALKLFAKHYKTDEIIPDELIDKIKKSSNYGAGYLSLRQLSLGYLDMAWYTNLDDVDSVEEFENKAIEKTKLFPTVPGMTISNSFGHIFSGGYSAGYYSYKWAEVLDADAFEKFKEDGIFNKQTASSFRNNILSKGGLKHPMDLYKNFRGREPQVEALLRRDDLMK
tara:strand:- start:14757 stop:16790 length:2034 start_codon:yes stop_codon:yes gene_type:complete